MAYAPAALRWLAEQWEAAIPSAVFSGIVGDSRHDYGYHRAPNEIPRSDYSLQLPGDRPEDGIDMNAADGLDMSMSTAYMILVTGRIYRSWLDQDDPRLNYQREAIGTLDGSTVIYMDCQLAQRGTADNSHLWHVHCGGLRIHANNMDAMRALLSVIKGETVAQWQAGGDELTPEQERVLKNAEKYLWRAAYMQDFYEIEYPVGNIIKPPIPNMPAATLRAILAKLDGLTNTVNVLAEALRSGGADIDTAAVLARLDERAAEDAARDAETSKKVADMATHMGNLETERDALVARLAQAYAETAQG